MKRFKNTAYSARLGEKIASVIAKSGEFSYGSLYSSVNPGHLPTAIPVNKINEYLSRKSNLKDIYKDVDEISAEYTKKRQDLWNNTMSSLYKGQTEVQATGANTKGFEPFVTKPPMYGKSKRYQKKFDKLSEKTGFKDKSKALVNEWNDKRDDLLNVQEASDIIKYGGIPGKDVTFYDGYRYCEIPKGYRLEKQEDWGAVLSKSNPDGSVNIVEFENGKVISGNFKYGKTSW